MDFGDAHDHYKYDFRSQSEQLRRVENTFNSLIQTITQQYVNAIMAHGKNLITV